MLAFVVLNERPVLDRIDRELGRDIIPRPPGAASANDVWRDKGSGCRGTLNGSLVWLGRRMTRGMADPVGKTGGGELGLPPGDVVNDVRRIKLRELSRGEIKGRGSADRRRGGTTSAPPERFKGAGMGFLCESKGLSNVGSEPDSAVDDIAVPDSVAVMFSNIPDDSESMLTLRTRLAAGRRELPPVGDEGIGGISGKRPGRRGGSDVAGPGPTPLIGGSVVAGPIRRAGGLSGGRTTGADGGGCMSPSSDVGRDWKENKKKHSDYRFINF